MPFVLAMRSGILLWAVALAIGCGGSDNARMHAAWTGDGCTYRGDKVARTGRFTIGIEDRTGSGAHFVLKQLAEGFTPERIQPALDRRGPGAIAFFVKDEPGDPVFSSDVVGDGKGVLLADAPAGTYVLLCRGSDVTTGGLQVAAWLEVTA